MSGDHLSLDSDLAMVADLCAQLELDVANIDMSSPSMTTSASMSPTSGSAAKSAAQAESPTTANSVGTASSVTTTALSSTMSTASTTAQKPVDPLESLRELSFRRPLLFGESLQSYVEASDSTLLRRPWWRPTMSRFEVEQQLLSAHQHRRHITKKLADGEVDDLVDSESTVLHDAAGDDYPLAIIRMSSTTNRCPKKCIFLILILFLRVAFVLVFLLVVDLRRVGWRCRSSRRPETSCT